MADLNALPARADVPQEQTWNLDSIYSAPENWQAACQKLIEMLPRLAAFQGRLGEAPQVLVDLLDLLQASGTIVGKIATYAYNAFAVDTTNQTATARVGQAQNLITRYEAAVAFLDPELLAIGFVRLEKWIEDTPELAFFSQYIERLKRRQKYVRSQEVEEVLAYTAEPFSAPSDIYTMLSDADLHFAPAVASDGSELEVGQASITGLRAHVDRDVRRTAWQSYADGYLAYKNSFAAALIGAVKQDVFKMRARGYDSALHASLEQNFIPVAVFHNLIQVFTNRLPLWHRYWRIRKKALGYTELYEYDIKAPLIEAKPVVPYSQAVEWIAAGMAPLGDEYVRLLRNGCTEQRWVDWARNKGKTAGAFSSGSHGTQPFIMMSYDDDLYSLSTLAHELGHSMHSLYAWENQPFLYGDYSLFVAEVASNFNQAMVRDYLYRTQTERNFRIALIEEAMANYHRYFFIMPTLARFELEMHQRVEDGAPLSAELLIERMADLFLEGYGSELASDRERTGITWAQFGHLYANFYVYQYATGISGANALARAILDSADGAAERYLSFLKTGDSRDSLEALRLAGVDLLETEPVERAFDVLETWVDRLEELVG